MAATSKQDTQSGIELVDDGERWIPGASPGRIQEDHLARYEYAARYTPGKRVMDVACGAGFGTYMMSVIGGAKVALGVDISSQAILYAQQNYQRPGLRYECADMTTREASEKFDVITCFETIEHVENPSAALMFLRRSIASDGVLLISSPNRPITSPRARTLAARPENPHHIREYRPQELANILSSYDFATESVLGQRLRFHLPIPPLQRGMAWLRKRVGSEPDSTSSPYLRPYRIREPRYFVIKASLTADKGSAFGSV